MKLLPLEKIWTGDGLGNSAAVTLTQLKRTEPGAKYPAALYKRTMKNGRPQGYEVFIIKTRLKGQPINGGGVEEEDRECYPRAKQFGKIAWAPGGLNHATEIYENLTQGLRPCDVTDNDDEDDVSEPEQGETVPVVKVTKEYKPVEPLDLPDSEFSTKELAEKNGVGYPVAFIFLKQAIATNLVKFVREERRNPKGKATKIFAKT